MSEKRIADSSGSDTNKKKNSRKKWLLLLAVLIATVVIYGVYRTLVNFYYFEIVLVVYTVLSVGITLTYFIYNRGMSRRGVTEDMLPKEWSREEKLNFINDGKERLRKSRWMLVIIIAFVITIALDATELFILPLIKGLYS